MGKIVIFLFFISIYSTQAQLDPLKPYVTISGVITDSTDKRLANVCITILEGNDTLKAMYTKSPGKYSNLSFNQGKLISLNFSKDGYISKRVIFDTKTNYVPGDAAPVTPIDIPIQLDTKKEGDIYEELENDFYIGKLIFDPATADLKVDMAYSALSKKQYDEVLINASKD